MSSDIIELQHKLSEARGEDVTGSSRIKARLASSTSKYRLRTAAAVEKDKKDASELLMLGVNPHEVSDLLGISLSEIARIEEDNQRRRKFLMTGNLDYIYS
jgi:hypothetical protein